MKEGITRETADIKFPKDSIVKNFYAIFFKLDRGSAFFTVQL